MAPPDETKERLLAAIDLIEADVAAVSLWACALSSFAQPVPRYQPKDLQFDFTTYVIGRLAET